MSRKSRVTMIIAHCSKKSMVKKFPDYNTIERLQLISRMGNVIDEIPKPGKEALNMIQVLAKMNSMTTRVITDKKQDMGWATINGTIYPVSEVSERKCSIRFESHNEDEADHYAKVDGIVKTLAENDIAVLQGECSITITTRC